MGYRIVVAGATELAGREMLNILAEREFPVDEIVALGSRKSIGTEVGYGDKTLKCRDIEGFDFAGWDIALFAMDAEGARKHAPTATRAGCVVIDGSSAFRLDGDVPLVVPEVNPDAITGYARRNIIASPGASVAQMLVALKPLHDRARIRRVVATTCEPVGDLGESGMDELWNQTKGLYVPGQEVAPKVFTRQIAFNIIPQVDEMMEDGGTRAEWALTAQAKKILDPKLRITATCLRVPVFAGNALSLNIEFEDFLDEDEARDLLRESPGLMVIDKRQDGGYITPVEAVGDFATYVSRIRQDSTVENGLSLWVVSDNLRKGTALNIVQIAELLGNRVLKKG